MKKILFVLIAVILCSCSSLGINKNTVKSTVILTDKKYALAGIKYQIIYQDGTVKNGKTDKNGMITIKLPEAEDFTLMVYRGDAFFYNQKLKYKKIEVIKGKIKNINDLKHVNIEFILGVKEFKFILIGGEHYFLDFERPSGPTISV